MPFPARPASASSGGRPLPGWWWAALVAVTLLVYFPALRGGFLWDDDANVTKPALRPASGLAQIWFEPGATEQYYPVLHSAFWLEHRLWGDQPAGYHLLNILLHAASACLVVVILRRLAVPGAALAGLLFAVHPVAVESVAWIAEQKNTLSTLFYLAALLAYLRQRERPTARGYALATGWFVLALASKSVTATLPPALLVIFWWQRGRLAWREDVRPLLPWLVLAVAAGLFTAWVERRFIGAEGAAFELTVAQRVLVAGHAVWFYLGKLAWPAELVFIYPRWVVDAADPWLYAYPVGVVVLLAGLWGLRRISRGPLAAALFFIGSLFPVLGFLHVYGFMFSYVTDHWQYLPSLGVITLAAAGITQLLDRAPSAARRAGGILVASLAALLGLLSWRQCANYRDPTTFYEAILARNPACRMAHNNLGLVLLQTGRRPEAVAHFEAALRLEPDYAKGHLNLANALAESGRPGDAIAHYEAALRQEPLNAKARTNFGNALGEVGRLTEAIRQFRAALATGPESAETRNSLGTALFQAGHPAEAIREYEAALRLAPDLVDARRNLANALFQTGRVPEALAHYEDWARLQPGSAEAQNLAGIALARLGRLPEARARFERAVQLDPGLEEARENLARVRGAR